jgi:hypothetical protein
VALVEEKANIKAGCFCMSYFCCHFYTEDFLFIKGNFAQVLVFRMGDILFGKLWFWFMR